MKDIIEANPENTGSKNYDLKWSGDFIPMIGDRIYVSVNSIGYGKVVGYFQEDGYLGVEVKLEDPPEWWIRNQEEFKNTRMLCYVFGAEIKRKKP